MAWRPVVAPPPGAPPMMMFTQPAGSVTAAPASPDWYNPPFADVSLLLHMDSDFTDSSSAPSTVSVTGAAVSTSQFKFGGGAGSFVGGGKYLSIPTSTKFGFGSGDYTIEGWAYQGAETADRCVFDSRTGSTEGISVYLSVNGSNQTGRLLLVSNAAILAGTGTPLVPTNTWFHWAVARRNGLVCGLINAEPVWVVADARTLASSNPVVIGANYLLGQTYNGYLDDIRVTKGHALYAPPAPSGAFPNS